MADIKTNPDNLRERAGKHFAAFKLARTFAVASANALSSVKASCELMAQLAAAFGQPARPMVEEWVTDQLKTARGKDASSWETAFFAACSASNEFLDGGYKQISTAVPVVVPMPASLVPRDKTATARASGAASLIIVGFAWAIFRVKRGADHRSAAGAGGRD